MDTLQSQSEPERDPYEEYREQYRSILNGMRTVFRRAGSLGGRK